MCSNMTTFCSFCLQSAIRWLHHITSCLDFSAGTALPAVGQQWGMESLQLLPVFLHRQQTGPQAMALSPQAPWRPLTALFVPIFLINMWSGCVQVSATTVHRRALPGKSLIITPPSMYQYFLNDRHFPREFWFLLLPFFSIVWIVFFGKLLFCVPKSVSSVEKYLDTPQQLLLFSFATSNILFYPLS